MWSSYYIPGRYRQPQPTTRMDNRDPQDEEMRHNNTKPDIYDPATHTWTIINKALGVAYCHDYAVCVYPRLHVVLHTGEIFIVQPLYSSQVYAPPPGSGCPVMTPNMSPCPTHEMLCSENPDDINPPYLSEDVMDKSLFYDVSTQQITSLGNSRYCLSASSATFENLLLS